MLLVAMLGSRWDVYVEDWRREDETTVLMWVFYGLTGCFVWWFGTKPMRALYLRVFGEVWD
jgi:hypothetical protein